ncbi:hypothetical protein VCV18_012413 [Metarhizium anisopliae]
MARGGQQVTLGRPAALQSNVLASITFVMRQNSQEKGVVAVRVQVAAVGIAPSQTIETITEKAKGPRQMLVQTGE